ncbi:MAG: type II secretion system protein [Phycisphaerales bacterium]|nr:type II secretion system protein [Phycisphaerales bacterium]
MSIHASSPSFDRRGFTLLETLLVIALIGILVTLMLPMATRTKELASMAALTARLGSHAKVISSYAQDYRDYMPAFTDPKATYTVLYVEDEPVRLVYFDTYWSWHLVLAGLVYDSTHRDGMFYDQAASGLAPVTDILYSSSFGASPAFWRDTTRTGPDQWRAMRLGEVQFPSQKAVYLASGTWRESRYSLAPLAFCDGSAEALTMDEVAWGYPNGTGNWPGSGLTASIPGMVTIDGVLGRDR